MAVEYDIIIVGAGSAGCVLAERLTRNPGTRVLLIEAGPEDKNPLIHMPKGLGKLLDDRRHAWIFPVEPEAGTGGKADLWVRGKMLGGSSSINGMMYCRGQPEDYEALAAVAGPEWGWNAMLGAFRAMEDHALGSSDWRGGDGPLHVTMPDAKDRLYEAMIDAGVRCGLQHVDDVNGPNGKGVIGYLPRTIWRGRRWSAARAFLKPARARPNLTILTDTSVDRVLITERRATGVICTGRHSGGYRGNEIILSAGALLTPKLLQLSGVGPADLLRKHGIEVVLDQPDVGRNMVEHRVASMQFRLNQPLSHNPQYCGWRLFGNVLKYLLAGRGVMAAGAGEVGAYVRTDERLDRPDAHLLMAPYTFDMDRLPLATETQPGMAVMGYVLRPESRGEVHIRSIDPAAAPVIRPRYLEADHDRRTAIALTHYIRRYVSQPPLAAMIDHETCPGSAITDDAGILDLWQSRSGTGYHAVGTCRMGLGADSVVDERLRVRGIDRLRVVDCSVFPQIPAGNTNAPVMALAWRAADLMEASTV